MRTAVASVRGAPGATTVALALSLDLAGRSRQVLLIEADPAGGVLAASLGIPVSPGLVDFTAAAHHRTITDVAEHNVQQLTASLCVLPSPSSGRQASAALEALVPELSVLLADTTGDVVVDVGRLLPGSPSTRLVDAADVVVLVVRPVVSELAALVPRLRELRDDGAECLVAVVDTPPRSPEAPATFAEVTDVLTDAARVLRLPHDPLAVHLLYADPTGHRWPRTRLATAVSQLADGLLGYEVSDDPADLVAVEPNPLAPVPS